MPVTEKDRDVLARTLWGEARGEGLAGMVAVAWSIRNRVDIDLHTDGKPDWWGEGYIGVCQKPWQFSCWNRNDPNFPFLSGAKAIPKAEFAMCQLAAQQVIDGVKPDSTGGATHYYATTMPKPPKWVVGAKQTLRLGHHIFFKDVP
ncbi:cell wall hydrolase [Pseudomonas huanghezhanensis]|uniref:cell wall hydrolase n=1 Tax=Pseudomonas huanghezhanensis TaxID=3002903 RepID=UPI002285B73D|nr:cell wall hydrolase [Pseudomonas sp. BSw22131]